MLQGIVFDFDGIIVDSEPLHYRAFLEVLRPMGIDFDYETYVREYIGFDDRDAFRHFGQIIGRTFNHAELADLITRKTAAFKELVGRGVEAFPGSVELIREAATAMPIAIASGALKHDIELILPNIGGGGVPKLFKTIVTANDVERSKPDPESYSLAVERLGLRPEACMAIEDTPAGLTSARQAGLRTLGVGHSYPADALTDYADHVVNALADVRLANLREWFP